MIRLACVGVVVVASAACPIGKNALIPGFGVPCDVTAADCDVDFVCIPDADDKNTGTCAPIADYGSCKKPTYAAGRLGTVRDEEDEYVVDEVSDLDHFEDDSIRHLVGNLLVAAGGQTAVTVVLDDLCAMHALQVVDDRFVLRKTTLTALDGLQSLTAVGNGFAIVNNNNLGDISALSALVDIASVDAENEPEVVIAFNESLPAADVADFADALHKRLPDARVVACANKGDRACSSEEQDLLDGLGIPGPL